MTGTTLTEGKAYRSGVELILRGDGIEYPVAVKFPNGVVKEFCKRCGGSGEYSFNLMDGTVCYGCGGRGLGATTTEADILRKAENRAKARDRAARKAEREYKAKAAVMDAWKAAHGDLLAALEPHLSRVDSEGYTDFDWRPTNNFLTDLADKAHRSVTPLTDRQVEAAQVALVREQQKAAEKAQAASETLAAGHYGQVGDKVNVTVTITLVKYLASERWDRQSSYLVTMKTAEGHILKTFSSGDFGREAEKGQTVTIKGTVKDHTSYDGLPQTMLARVTKIS